MGAAWVDRGGESGGITTQQLDDREKSADDVFKLLQLKNEGETLFKDPSFSRWVSYVRSIDEKNADTHMYTILRTAYGDDELAPMLVGAKKSGMGDVAKRVEAVQEEV